VSLQLCSQSYTSLGLPVVYLTILSVMQTIQTEPLFYAPSVLHLFVQTPIAIIYHFPDTSHKCCSAQSNLFCRWKCRWKYKYHKRTLECHYHLICGEGKS